MALSIKSGTVYCIYRLLLVDLLEFKNKVFPEKRPLIWCAFTLISIYIHPKYLIMPLFLLSLRHIHVYILSSLHSQPLISAPFCYLPDSLSQFFRLPSLRSVQRGIEKQPTVKEKRSETGRGGEM